jgi:hypothetical protein
VLKIVLFLLSTQSPPYLQDVEEGDAMKIKQNPVWSKNTFGGN